MKRVLVLVYTPTYGGPHNQIVQLYKPLLSEGWETVALLPNADKTSYKKLTDQNIKVLTRPLKRLRAKNILSNNFNYLISFRENVREIKDVINRENIDVVQVCGLMHIHAAFACKELGVPLVWQFLGTFAPLPLRMLYTPFASWYADSIMTTGLKTAKQHVFYTLFKDKHKIFYPPVNTQKFTYTENKRKIAREWMEVPDDAFLVGTVGNQNKTKGHEFFIDIADKLSFEKDIYFRIVGKHTPSHAEYYKREVIDRAYESELIQKNKLLIKEDELPIDLIMSGFDAFLLTSRIEGMPTVILEAMSVGLPIITNEVGSVKEVIATNKNGFIYNSYSEAVGYILKLKNSRELHQKISSLNKLEAQDKYDVTVCAQNHVTVYESVL